MIAVNEKLKEKVREALTSVLPVTMIVFVLSVTFLPIPIDMITMFLVGAAMLVVGMGFFSLGVDMAMMPMSESIGVHFAKKGKLLPLVLVSLVLGIMITVAEPDLQVLAEQVPSIPNSILIGTVAIGIGVILAVSAIRGFFQIGLAQTLTVLYLIVFVVAAFTPADFVPVAFDSGGVTTGPIAVPFIMAFGIGLSSVKGESALEDSFGPVALCTMGPVLAVMILGLTYGTESTGYTQPEAVTILTTQDVAVLFAKEMPSYFKDVFLAVVPVAIFFAFFQMFTKKFVNAQLVRIGIGFIYTTIGIALFLTGVNVGFIPVGQLLGSEVASSSYKWALVPLGMIIGYYIVAAEPSVPVLNKQVENISGGLISQRAMMLSLSIGVSLALGLTMVRILTGMSILWLLIPGYTIALFLTRFVPKIFVGIAFDSGSVASGPMASTFLLPFAMGACKGAGGNVLTDAFGVVAMVTMTPVIIIQLLGLIYSKQMQKAIEMDADLQLDSSDDIVVYDEEGTQDGR